MRRATIPTFGRPKKLILSVVRPALRTYLDRGYDAAVTFEAPKSGTGNRGSCPREPDFWNLYAVLGDRDAQEEIRKKNPGVEHCDLLRVDSAACSGCVLCPVRDAEDDERTEPDEVAEETEALNASFGAICYVIDVTDHVQYGSVSLSDLRPETVELVRDVLRYRRGELPRAIAQIVNAAFGGTEKKSDAATRFRRSEPTR